MTVSTARPSKPQIRKVQLRASEFGLADRPLIVHAPMEQKPFLMVSAALLHKHVDPGTVDRATHRFVKVLFAHERVDTEPGARRLRATANATRQQLRKSHVLIESAEGYRLTRRLFHCGWRT